MFPRSCAFRSGADAIADGELEIRVVGKTDEELDCEFVVGGAMRSRKASTCRA